MIPDPTPGPAVGSIGLDGASLIVPEAIPMPGVAVEELHSTARGIRGDGQELADTGHSIRHTWQILQNFYRAPEAGELFAATDPVADRGEEVNDALSTVASALAAFADAAERITNRLRKIKAAAEVFVAEAGEDWQKDPEKVGRNLRFKADVNKAIAEYQDAERDCANKITDLYDGPTFVPDTGKPVGDGQLAYGMDDRSPDTRVQIEDAWGAVRAVDKPWWGDIIDAQMDMGVGALVEQLVWSTGAIGEHGRARSLGDMLDNAIDYQIAGFQGRAQLIGVSFDENWRPSWALGTAGDAWGAVVNGFTAWDQRHDRPAYTAYTTLGNTLPLLVGGGVGAARTATQATAKVGQLARGLRGGNGEKGTTGSHSSNSPHNPRTPAHSQGNASADPTTRQLQEEVDKFQQLADKLGSYDKAFAQWEKSKTPALEPVGAGARGGDPSPTASAGNGGEPPPRSGGGSNMDAPNSSQSGARGSSSPTSLPTGEPKGGTAGGRGSDPMGGESPHWRGNSPRNHAPSEKSPDYDGEQRSRGADAAPADRHKSENTDRNQAEDLSTRESKPEEASRPHSITGGESQARPEGLGDGAGTSRSDGNSFGERPSALEVLTSKDAPKGDGTPGAVNRDIDGLVKDGPLGDDFKRDVVQHPKSKFGQHEWEIARLRADEGRHVTGIKESGIDGVKNMDVRERSGPDDPGRLVEYKTVQGESNNAIEQQIRNALKKFKQDTDSPVTGGDIVIDGRDKAATENALKGMEGRLGRDLKSGGGRVGRVGRMYFYTKDGDVLIYEDGVIYKNGVGMREWRGESWHTM
ncbi:hypothetical protein HNR23_004394 [Nocardiopsis mwathae]|uniref:Uncharacterized protein n=1 Tax=Nocardiopsis mwathae TaxID=1472723 RepID=A0A7X0D8S8_9ACTN|nr:hypothetical protein [Nocardiopsis mwathae]MBB6174334.1 hypothetical protein [Nocardiopsis mwathae]